MTTLSVCIGAFNAQDALQSLRASGVDDGQVSLVGKDDADDRQIHGYHTTGEVMRFWGTQGALWGSLMGVLAGVGLIFIPGIGPLLIGGPMLSMLVGGVEGGTALAGVEALFAGVSHLAFTKDSLVLYESQLKAGKWLLVVHGDTESALRAKTVLDDAKASHVAVHAS